MAIGLGMAFFAVVSVGALWGYRWATGNRYFALRDVQVRGNVHLTYAEVVEAAGVELGRNCLRIGMDGVIAGIEKNPWVEAVKVRRELPDTFKITVRERVPAFWVRREGKIWYADRQGRVIDEMKPDKFIALPVLEAEEGAGGDVERLPDLLDEALIAGLPFRVTDAEWLRLTAGGDVEIALSEPGVKVAVGTSDWRGNLRRAVTVWNALAARGELERARGIRAHAGNVWVALGG